MSRKSTGTIPVHAVHVDGDILSTEPIRLADAPAGSKVLLQRRHRGVVRSYTGRVQDIALGQPTVESGGLAPILHATMSKRDRKRVKAQSLSPTAASRTYDRMVENAKTVKEAAEAGLIKLV